MGWWQPLGLALCVLVVVDGRDETAYGQRLRTGLDRSCAIGWLGLALPRVYRRGEGRHAFLALTMVMVHARYTCVRYAFSSVPYTSDWCVEPGRGRGRVGARRSSAPGPGDGVRG